MTIGFDVSSKIIGYALLDNAKIVDAGIVDLRKHSDYFGKYTAFEIFLCNLKQTKLITNVWIEESAKFFMSGRSSASTIIKLASMNVICQILCEKILSIKPIMINVSTARRLVAGKIPAASKNKKQYIFDWFLANHKEYVYFLPAKTHKKTKITSFDSTAFDVVDSIIIAMAGQICSENPLRGQTSNC